MTNGTPEPAMELTPLELAIFQAEARELQEKYAAQRDAHFLSQGREYHTNARPGRPI